MFRKIVLITALTHSLKLKSVDLKFCYPPIHARLEITLEQIVFHQSQSSRIRVIMLVADLSSAQHHDCSQDQSNFALENPSMFPNIDVQPLFFRTVSVPILPQLD